MERSVSIANESIILIIPINTVWDQPALQMPTSLE